MRGFRRLWLWLPPVVSLVGCYPAGHVPDLTSSTSSGSGGGTGGGGSGCDVDCSGFQTAQCTVAVCNTGQVAGPKNTCVVVPVTDGDPCDDGLFCTVGDSCSQGACVGGGKNDCGNGHDSCESVICYEDSKSCSVVPSDDGTSCTPTDLCEINGVCTVGACVGVLNDCKSSPLSECNLVACDSTTGACTGTPDPGQDGNPCVLTGDLCNVEKACSSGQCAGGRPIDCSSLDVACQVGACDPTTGVCAAAPVAIGTACSADLPACQVGACDMRGMCVVTTAPDGSACNDHDSCTAGDACTAGACGGLPIAGCQFYLFEDFKTCPDGWTLGGDWQCGMPTATSPVTSFDGNNVLATQLDGAYDNNQSFALCTASSPPIDLTKATSPQVSLWAWVDTNTGDGWNLKASTDGGQTFKEVTTVTPAYPLTALGQPSWGGDLSARGWQPYSADLTAYAGLSVILSFGFGSDSTSVGPGVYIDNITVAEPALIPLYITTPSPLLDAYVGRSYLATLARVGGSSNAVWTIDSGSVNAGWLSIDAATGVISGTPTTANLGPVSITVHVEEPSQPSNFADQAFTFNVDPDLYYTSWEGACPGGWTLLGDWQCGVPTNTAGPATASAGTQCLGTGMVTDYSNNDTWAATTATSPPIDFTGVVSPTLTFRMWIDTEGGLYDGANLQISTDGGLTYSVVTTVMPVYSLTIASEPAWGGHQAGLGWQLVQADLTAYANKHVLLRFAFQSDASGTWAGAFVDDFLVQ